MIRTKGGVMFVALSAILAGCSTVDTKRIDDMEARLTTLERKTETTQPGEATAASEAAVTSSAATEEKTEVTAPDSPSKEEIQAALKKAGYYTGDIDGKFGSQTKKAIEEFQSANDLTVDGRVGPNTWTKLREYYTPVESKSVAEPKSSTTE